MVEQPAACPASTLGAKGHHPQKSLFSCSIVMFELITWAWPISTDPDQANVSRMRNSQPQCSPMTWANLLSAAMVFIIVSIWCAVATRVPYGIRVRAALGVYGTRHLLQPRLPPSSGGQDCEM